MQGQEMNEIEMCDVKDTKNKKKVRKTKWFGRIKRKKNQKTKHVPSCLTFSCR